MTGPTDRTLLGLSKRVGRALLAKEATLTTAESCTGGWISKVLTDVPGSSAWFRMGYVTYSNEAKTRLLGVSERALRRDGAVSQSVVAQMARGALRAARADLAVAVSGVAGPDGGSVEKPVGTVWIGVARRVGRTVTVDTFRRRFAGDREAVRRRTVACALKTVLTR
jgi:nicotinamide-nucleotide amidase